MSRLKELSEHDKAVKQRVERRLGRRMSADEIERVCSLRNGQDWLTERWWKWVECKRAFLDDAGLQATGLCVMQIQRVTGMTAARRTIVDELGLPRMWRWHRLPGEPLAQELANSAYEECRSYGGDFPEWRDDFEAFYRMPYQTQYAFHRAMLGMALEDGEGAVTG